MFLNKAQKQELKKFFEQSSIKQCVEEDEWQLIFNSWFARVQDEDDFSCLTQLLVDANIPFLDDMSVIMSYMFYGVESEVEDIVVPENIRIIEHYGFANCSAKIINIYDNGTLKPIEGNAFDGWDGKEIIFHGSRDRWSKLISNYEVHIPSSISVYVVESDGTVHDIQ